MAAGSRAYLDWNATAPLRPAAAAAMREALGLTGNPSSVHTAGRAARALVESARGKVAALTGAEPHNVVFTAGGTEANVLALSPKLRRPADAAPVERLLVSAIEHACVREGHRFPPERVETIAVTPAGVVDLADLERRLGEPRGRALVAIMAANNETGAVQPVAEAAALVHAAGGLLHVDAVQIAGKAALDLGGMGADLVAVSSHKLGGPQGAGALILCDETLQIDPLFRGGGQERGRRAGTENVAAIAGFGAAAEQAARELPAQQTHAMALQRRLEDGLRRIAPATVIFSSGADRLPNTTLFALSGVRAETALISLDLKGVAVSSGSACSSGKVGTSHVLAAMGVAPELARGAIRVSTGYSTTQEDIDCLLEAWRLCLGALGKGEEEIAA